MTKLSIFLSILLCSIPALPATHHQFTMQTLNCKNKQELEAVAILSLSSNNTSQASINKTMQNFINRQNQKLHKIWVCKSFENQEICGFIYCSYGKRNHSIADIEKLEVHRDYNWSHVAEAMITHAKNFYRNLGMKQIMIYRPSNYKLYKNLGFYDVSEEVAHQLVTGIELGVWFACGMIFPPCLLMTPYLIAQDL